MAKLTFAVKGMHCAGCAASVERAVRKLPGAAEVYVNFAADRLTLDAAPELSAGQVVEAVRAAGFTAEPLGGDPARLEFDVRGMHCAGCAASLEKAVAARWRIGCLREFCGEPADAPGGPRTTFVGTGS